MDRENIESDKLHLNVLEIYNNKTTIINGDFNFSIDNFSWFNDQ